MPKPTAAANAAPLPATTRRAVLKAAGALGTVAALEVPVAILPKAEAAEHPDAALLAMGRRIEALWARENELVAEEKRLVLIAERIRPAPAPELLAYERGGAHLMYEDKGRLWVDFRLQDHLRTLDRACNTPNTVTRPRTAALLAALDAWHAGGEEARRTTGAEAVNAEFERVTDEISELCRAIIGAAGKTAAGVMVKMRALEWCYPEEVHTDTLRELAEEESSNTSERLIASALLDALAILNAGGANG
jgi:hypothetical protein